jgi:hypothetical protein
LQTYINPVARLPPNLTHRKSQILSKPAAGHSAGIVASPCSGHGFKFAPVIGEIIADLATTGTTDHNIRRFSVCQERAEMKRSGRPSLAAGLCNIPPMRSAIIQAGACRI